jgi:tetratricopeptide (TPR) repeat protein
MRSGLDYNFDDLSIAEQHKYLTETPFIAGPGADQLSAHYSARLDQYRTLSKKLAKTPNTAYKKQKALRQQLFLIDPFNPQLLEDFGNLWAAAGFAGHAVAIQYWSAALTLDSSRTALNNLIQESKALSHWDFQFNNFDNLGLNAPLSQHIGTGKYLLEAVLDANQSHNPHYQKISEIVIKYIDLYVAKTPLDTIKNDSYGKYVFECAAYAYMILNQNQAALTALNKHIQLNDNSQNAPIYVKRGKIYSRLGNINEAINDFEHAVLIDPLSPSARVALREERRRQNILNREKAEAQTALENKAMATYGKAIQACAKQKAPETTTAAPVISIEEDRHSFTAPELTNIAKILLLIIQNNRGKAITALNQRGIPAHESLSKLSDALVKEDNVTRGARLTYEKVLNDLNESMPEKIIHSAINGVKAIPTLLLGALPTIRANAVMSNEKYKWLTKLLKTQLDESRIFQHPHFTGWTRMHVIYHLSRALQPFFVAKPYEAPEVKFLIRQRDIKKTNYQNKVLIDAIQQAIQSAKTAFAPLADCLANYLQPCHTINREKIAKIIADVHAHYFSEYNQKALNALFSAPTTVAKHSKNTLQARAAEKLQSQLLAAEKSIKSQLLEIDGVIGEEQAELLQNQAIANELHAKIALNEQLVTRYRKHCNDLLATISELQTKVKDTQPTHTELSLDLDYLQPQLIDMQDQLHDFNVNLATLQAERKALLDSATEKKTWLTQIQYKQTILAAELIKVQDLLTPRSAAQQQKALLAASQLQDAKVEEKSSQEKSSQNPVVENTQDSAPNTVSDFDDILLPLFNTWVDPSEAQQQPSAPVTTDQVQQVTASNEEPVIAEEKSSASTVERDMNDARNAAQSRIASPRLLAPIAAKQKQKKYSVDEKKSTSSPVENKWNNVKDTHRLFTLKKPVNIISVTEGVPTDSPSPSVPQTASPSVQSAR